MGEVSLACERGAAGGDDRLVALKLVHRELAQDPKLIESLTREATIIARLDHENVVRIFRLGEQDGRWFIAMELVQGASLRALIDAAAKTSLPIDACVGAVAQACRGAHAAHEIKDEEGRPLGLVHRDITPHNIMVDERGIVKLLDFGVALVRGSERDRGIVGKHPYLSPEQAQGKPLDRRSDVFALGTVLWELLAGRRRFPSNEPRENIEAIAKGASPSLAGVRPDVPPLLVSVLDRALAFEPDARFRSASAFAGALLDAAVELKLEIGERALARLMTQHVGAQMAQSARKLSAYERTQSLTTMSFGAEDTGRATFTTDPLPSPSSPSTMATTPTTTTTTTPTTSPSLDLVMPTVAVGANFELTGNERLGLCRVWSRPDLSREDGAKSAQDLVVWVVQLLERDGLRGFILDVRDARMVLGGKTLGVLETIFGTAEKRGVRISALIATDPIQRLDFADLVARVAPKNGRVHEDAREARRFSG